MSKEKSFFMALGWVTLLVFPAVSLAIYEWTEGEWYTIFKNGWPVWYQLGLGVGAGVVLGFLLRAYLRLPFMRPIQSVYRGLLKPIGLERREYIFLSVCAGVGEEILFRGVIQPFAGIYVTAVLFVALHGYLNPTNWRLLSYGFLLTAIFVGVGFMATYIGIYACILLHIIIDIYLFGMLDEDSDGVPQNPGKEDGAVSDI